MTTRPEFTFVELFAGIGGFRCGLEPLGGKCIYSSEWDRHSARTYLKWYNEQVDTTDFRDIDYSTIPSHDILTAGFPCQPFSLAGVSKKIWLGQPHGFNDIRQGNLFEHIMKLVDRHEAEPGMERPPVLFMENVKNLLYHDRGRTWRAITKELYNRGYHLFHEVINASTWVPQHRERVYIVCFDMNVFGDDRTGVGFRWPDPPDSYPILGDILEASPDKHTYRLSKTLWDGHERRLERNIRRNRFIDTYRRSHRKLLAGAPDQDDAEKRDRFISTYRDNHRKLIARAPNWIDVTALDSAVEEALSRDLGNPALEDAVRNGLPKKRGFGRGLAAADGQTRTLSARYHKDGAEILYKQPGWQRPRRLTPVECGRLMGFPEEYVQDIVVSNTQAYRQFGNAVVPPVVQAIGQEIIKILTVTKQTRMAALTRHPLQEWRHAG